MKPDWILLVAGCLFVAGCGNDDGPAATPPASGRQVTLHVHDLDSQAAEDAVRGVLTKQRAVSAVTVDRAGGKVSFTLAAAGSVDGIIGALKTAGYTAHEGEHSQPDHPEHPKKDSEHPEHPKKDSEHPEHPK